MTTRTARREDDVGIEKLESEYEKDIEKSNAALDISTPKKSRNNSLANGASQHPTAHASQPETTTPIEALRKEVDVPPNGGYGWVCVAACATINAHTWGLNSAYAVFLAYYLANNVFPGATPLHYAFIGGLSISQALIVSPLATLTTRVFNTRTTLLIGVVLETVSFIGASFASKIWHLFLTQGLCFGWGMGFLFVGSVGIAAQWFTTHRSLANGISAAGSGIGGLIYSLAAQAMIRNIGLPWAFRILGIIAFVVNTSCSLLIKDRNKQIGSSQLSFDYRLFKKLEFVGLMAFGFLSMLGYVVLLFSLPNYARTVGLSSKQGSIIGALLNLGQALGRPPIGYFSDSFGRLNMASTMTFLCGVFCLLIWMFAKSFGLVVFFGMLGGTVAGTYWAVAAPVTTEVMGIKRLPSALSITWLVLVLPTTFSEPIGLEIVSRNGGSYTGAILFTGWMYVGGAVSLWLVRAWKIGELEEEAAREGKVPGEVDPVGSVSLEGGLPDGFQRSAFLKRMVMWYRV
ncbi:major facilitator superfamily domain-containing protein [Paraphoma chrysanthemicola]|uniref:Major facilitator superfamily domain-containing protein n=1 Tax=Paraphoma chrysanthemicola TaxID=798071 RepID=A0A8K0RIM7_9PLEO|nr:major facilitator superfamily domain-containing protein [Paraphoma chrysanthemicola]